MRDLSADDHVTAPDYPGFGPSEFPSPDGFDYTFDNLANYTDTFLDQRGITECALVLHEY